MPGPKRSQVASMPTDGEAIVNVIEIEETDLEVPSTEGYVSTREVKTKTPDGLVTETEYYWTKKQLARWLAACPKISIQVELDQISGETNPATARPWPVYIDGYRIDVPKGVSVRVPLPIAQILWNMQTEYRTSQSKGIDLYRIDPNNPNDYGLEIPALSG